MKIICAEHGPEQIHNYKFPGDDKNRKFSVIHYRQKLANGEYVDRDWLQYSISTNQVATNCFRCLLFSQQNKLPAIASTGSNDWHNISAILTEHQKTQEHKMNYNVWKDFEKRLKKNELVHSKLLQKIEEEENFWRDILERLIGLVEVLAYQNLAFQGSNDKLYTPGNGNFLKFNELIALFDDKMKEHIRRIINNEMAVHYLGKNIQNELIRGP